MIFGSARSRFRSSVASTSIDSTKPVSFPAVAEERPGMSLMRERHGIEISDTTVRQFLPGRVERAAAQTPG